MANTRICSIDGCGKTVLARGWCSRHWQRWNRHGDPLAGGITRGGLIRWIEEVALQYGGGDCLIWPYGTNGNGYSKISQNGRMMYVHRLICERKYGPPPTSKHDAAHSCGKGHLRCVNPHHLRWATRKENFADKLLHGTHGQGERHAMAKLTEAQVSEIRDANGLHREIAKRFGVTPQTISDIKRRRSWRHVC